MNQQNHGLALELDGLSFRPNMNKISLHLTADVKSLASRLPDMMMNQQNDLQKKRDEALEMEKKTCPFVPLREASKMTEKYLRRVGRVTTTPEDFFKYHHVSTPSVPLSHPHTVHLNICYTTHTSTAIASPSPHRRRSAARFSARPSLTRSRVAS